MLNNYLGSLSNCFSKTVKPASDQPGCTCQEGWCWLQLSPDFKFVIAEPVHLFFI